jgi:hypothetical protein
MPIMYAATRQGIGSFRSYTGTTWSRRLSGSGSALHQIRKQLSHLHTKALLQAERK